MQLLEKVTSAEAQRGKAVRQKELDQQRALDMLPGTFDVMRAVYGDKGPCVKPKSEVGGAGCRGHTIHAAHVAHAGQAANGLEDDPVCSGLCQAAL